MSSSFEGFGLEFAARIVTVTTDRGARGWGRARSGGSQLNGEHLVGRRVDALFDLEVGVVEEARSIDFALHDLVGRIVGVPVAGLLTSQPRASVPCYEGSIGMDDILPHDRPRGIQAIVDRCDAAYAAGYRAFKLKIGRGQRWMARRDGLTRDIEVTQAVRKQFPETRLAIDANDAFSCDEFLQYIDAVAELDLHWIEEPFPEERDSLTRLKDALAVRSPTTLVADGETDFAIERVLPLAREGLIDVLLMDVGTLGFTGWRWVLRQLEGTNILVSPHTCCNPLKIAYCAQLAASNSRFEAVESYQAHVAGVSLTAYEPIEGSIRLPAGSGFGLEHDLEKV